MAATSASDVTDGPVLSLINKRVRALRKKFNRIVQMEEAISQGKLINKEQEEVLRSKPAVVAQIDELEKLRQPLAVAVLEEIKLAVQQPQVSLSPQPLADNSDKKDGNEKPNEPESISREPDQQGLVEDLLNLLYFGSLFDVKSQSDFTSTMLTRTHERGCCLTYDYVTDEATDLLGEKDLDLISKLCGLLISRPVDSSLSHKNALHRCLEHAKQWLDNSDQPIEPSANITYAGLRERLNKIMASDYYITTPEMKAPVEVAAAAGNYASFQPVHSSISPVSVPVQVENSVSQFQQVLENSVSQFQQDEGTSFQGHEIGDDQPNLVEELQEDDEVGPEYSAEGVPVDQEQVRPEAEVVQRDFESKDQQYAPRRSYQNQRGGRGAGGGRRGYPNGRGGRSGSRGGGPYQNGRSQYYDQLGGYYPRSYYNNRGRGGRGGGPPYNSNNGSVQVVGS